MRLLQARRCNVLPLGEAVERVRANALPERSVVLTFDDGLFDFKARALPVLQEFGYPSTVYLTTYYCEHNLPVFRVTCSYLLWQCRAQQARKIEMDEGWIEVNPASHAGREETLRQIDKIVAREQLSGVEKHSFLVRFAAQLGADMERILSRRILHLMTPGRFGMWRQRGWTSSYTRTGTALRGIENCSCASLWTTRSGSRNSPASVRPILLPERRLRSIVF